MAHSPSRLLILTLALVGATSRASPALIAATDTVSLRVDSRLLDPHEHPDYERRAVKPPSWDTFGRRTQFTSLRGFNVQGDRIVGYTDEIDRYTRRHELGTVLWPSYPILFATNLAELADEVLRRQLYLFDVWGYVPGSGPGGYWQQFKPPAEAFALLERTLGDRWLGTDIGEQDGRYIGGYAEQMTPASASRFEQYLNFQRHFERMGDDLGHKHATLVSLNFGHYLLKEGTFTLIGAETAQALPNSQVYYAFIRGAGKQYGVPWFGNASIYNRWGFKTYGSSGRGDGYDFGPTKGTSLSLMKRLLYSHLLYNSMVVGFENGWFEGDRLSPIGQIQEAAQRWVKQHGQPGVLHTPVALLLDFYSGWTFPRHLYSDKVYRVWGNLPYEPGDHLTDGILDLVYPGYQDASYFHDESGFLVRTPHGDIADCLLSDAPSWLLQRYPVVIVAGALAGGRELRDKLQAYVVGGGHLVITSGNLARLPGGLCDIGARPNQSAANESSADAARLQILRRDANRGFVQAPVTHGAVVLAHGRGTLTVLESGFGVQRPAADGGSFRSEVDRPLAKPLVLTEEARGLLEPLLRRQMLFEVDRRLALITCRQGPGAYTLGLFNNTWRELPLTIVSHCGPIESVRELALEQAEKQAVGYLPEGVDHAGLGTSREGWIAGGDVRVFAVRVAERGVEETPHTPPPRRPRNRFLPLRRPNSIKEAILARPTFFQHFDGVIVDWRYLRERERDALRGEAGWIRRQGLRVLVDFSSGIDLYPTLRLIDNVADDYAASRAAIADGLAKAGILGAGDALVSLHRHPENNFTDDQTRMAFAKTLQALAEEAAQSGLTLHLRMTFGKPPHNLAEAAQWLERVKSPNLKLAPSIALLPAGAPESTGAIGSLQGRIGLWLVSGARKDVAGRLWDAHAPLHAADPGDALSRWLALAPAAPVALDAVYGSPDEEYLDAVALDRVWR